MVYSSGTDVPEPRPHTMPDATPSGPFFTSWGPLDGPILDAPTRAAPYIPTLGLHADPMGLPIGMAFHSGRLDLGRHAVATFRLKIGKAELPGRYVCVGRRFVEESDFAGGLA